MRDILVDVSSTDPWSSGLHYACVLASSMHAVLTGLHCPETDRLPVFAVGNAVVAGDAQPRDGAIEAAWAKEGAFRAYASSLGVKHCAWVVHDGSEPRAIEYLAQWHDLVVLDEESPLHHQLVAQAPCLIVPEAWSAAMPPACAVVLWDGSLSSIKALHAAVPLLGGSQRVVLLMGGTHGSMSLKQGLPPFDLDRYCEGHELDAERAEMDETWAGADVVHRVLASGADLLVMAAHGRTSMSNRLLDHRTQYVLEHCPVPILLRR